LIGHIETMFAIEDNIRRTNPREKGCGRPRTMFLKLDRGWLLKTGEATIVKLYSPSNGDTKEETQLN